MTSLLSVPNIPLDTIKRKPLCNRHCDIIDVMNRLQMRLRGYRPAIKMLPGQLRDREIKGQLLKDIIVLLNFDETGLVNAIQAKRVARRRGYRLCHKCGDWHKRREPCPGYIAGLIAPAMDRYIAARRSKGRFFYDSSMSNTKYDAGKLKYE